MTIEIRLEETLYRDFTTHDPAACTLRDADALPTCDVFMDNNDVAILSPTVTKRVGLTGHYRVPIAVTYANGFRVAHSYNVAVSATVNGYVSKAIIETIQVIPRRRIGTVAADAGNTATTFKTDLVEATNDWWTSAFVLFIENAALTQQVKKITGWNSATQFITCNAFTGAPTAGDQFVIVNF